jgi:RNA polymerase sigma-70 factor, ECF subfamily
MTDRVLVDQARRGDREAFTVLVRRYQRMALSLAWRMTGNAAAADDVSQESFVRAFRSLAAFRGDASFKNWLMRIVVHTASNYRRSRKREHPDGAGSLEGRPATDGDPEESLLRGELVARVQDELALLPPHHRAVVVLREYEDCSYQEIAEVLGIPLGTVMSRLAKARELLRGRLAQYCQGVEP